MIYFFKKIYSTLYFNSITYLQSRAVIQKQKKKIHKNKNIYKHIDTHKSKPHQNIVKYNLNKFYFFLSNSIFLSKTINCSSSSSSSSSSHVIVGCACKSQFSRSWLFQYVKYVFLFSPFFVSLCLVGNERQYKNIFQLQLTN